MGFSLLEVIFAILLLTTAILAVFSLIGQSISFLSFPSQSLLASYLAQEGIEIVRNIRETNWIKGESWDSGLPPSPPYYGLDYQSQSLPSPGCSEEGYLKFDGNFYRCSSDPNSPFRRKVSLTKKGDNVLEVKVEVSWQERGKTHQVTNQTRLYNWFGALSTP